MWAGVCVCGYVCICVYARGVCVCVLGYVWVCGYECVRAWCEYRAVCMCVCDVHGVGMKVCVYMWCACVREWGCMYACAWV